MPRIFKITINLERLRENLSRQEGRPLSEAEVLQWLEDAGCRRSDAHWEVHEADLGQLDPGEVISAEVVGEDDASEPNA